MEAQIARNSGAQLPPPPPPPCTRNCGDEDNDGGEPTTTTLVTVVPDGQVCQVEVSCSVPDPLLQVPFTTTQNPIDSDNGLAVGVIINNNLYGEPESYQVIYNSPDSTSTWEWDWGANSSISDWNQLLIPVAVRAVQSIIRQLTGATVCPQCVPAITVYTVADLTNQSISVTASSHNDPPSLFLTPDQQNAIENALDQTLDNPFILHGVI